LAPPRYATSNGVFRAPDDHHTRAKSDFSTLTFNHSLTNFIALLLKNKATQSHATRVRNGSTGASMRSIAFLSQKGGVGRTTLAASLAVAAAGAGERVIALDLDPQASLVSWGERRKAANPPNKLVIEPLEGERLPLLRAILEGLAEAGFTLAIFDTAANSATARLVALAADICLLPTRPTRLDVDVAAATFRASCLAERKAALLLNQCPPTYPSLRTSEAAKA
jgi:chromosome partitioning protein